MRTLIVAIGLTMFSSVAPVEAQTYPSRTITIVVPFPPGGSTDVVARIMAERMQPSLGQSVIIENVGGAGGSIAVGRVARASPDGYTIDIGQWDTHVGSVIYPADLRSAEGFRADRADLHQSAADGRQENLAGGRPEGARRLDEGEPRQGEVRQPERGSARVRHSAAAVDRHERSVRPLSRRRSRPCRIWSPGMSICWWSRRPLRCRRCGRGRSRQSRTCRRAAPRPCPTSRPPTRAACPDSTCRDGSGFSRPKARRRRHRQAQWRDGAGACRSGRARAVHRAWTGRRLARAADAGRARRIPQGRDREVVADHQGGRHQTGMITPVIPCEASLGERDTAPSGKSVRSTRYSVPSALLALGPGRNLTAA